MDTIVMFSGGQDSCTMLEYAVAEAGPPNVLALSVIYGQRHAIELECAKQYAKMLEVEHQIIDASFFGALVPSALTGDGSVSMPHPFIPNVPASFVPNRNALLLTLGHAIAQARGASNVIGGMCQTDYSGYPDCREEFIMALEHALNIGSNADIVIRTPLMYRSKAQTFVLAAELNALERVIEYSHTCYEGNHTTRHEWGYGCGECPACQLRAKGYQEFLEL